MEHVPGISWRDNREDVIDYLKADFARLKELVEELERTGSDDVVPKIVNEAEAVKLGAARLLYKNYRGAQGEGS